MAVISVGGYNFNIEPNTASWSYDMFIKPIDTYGGRVIQLLSCDVKAFSVEGHIRPKQWDGSRDLVRDFDINQWQGMREFESNVKSIMAFHESQKESVSFTFPEVGWNGYVYLVSYGDVRYNPELAAVTYTLQFEVDSGFDDIQRAASDEGLRNIPDGVGWVRNVYNTPKDTSWSKVKEALEDFVDDAGTFDASNPADFYSYMDAVMQAEDEETKKAVFSGETSLDDGRLFGDVAQEGVDTTISFMKRFGIEGGA